MLASHATATRQNSNTLSSDSFDKLRVSPMNVGRTDAEAGQNLNFELITEAANKALRSLKKKSSSITIKQQELFKHIGPSSIACIVDRIFYQAFSLVKTSNLNPAQHTLLLRSPALSQNKERVETKTKTKFPLDAKSRELQKYEETVSKDINDCS